MTLPPYPYPSDWEISTLEQNSKNGVILKVNTGGTPSTRKPEYWGGTIPWLTPKEITQEKSTRYVSLTERTITKLSNPKLLPERTVLLTKRAPLGDVVINKISLAINQGFLGFRCGVKLLPEFLYYWFKTNQKYLDAVANGTTYQELYNSDLFELQIGLPSIEEQRTIVQILGTLDDKLDNIQKQAKILDDVLKSIFKSWFLDMEKETSNSKSNTLKLKNFIDVEHGYAFKGEFFKDNPTKDILLTPGNFAIGGGFKDIKLKYYDGPIPKKYILDEDDLLISMTDLSKNTDTLGYPMLVPPNDDRIFLHNQRLGKIIITAPDTISKNFLYYLFRTNNYRNEILASATGTTVKHTSPERIKDFEFHIPDQTLINEFDKISLMILSKIKSDYKLALILKKIHGFLLPTLISGQIRVSSLKIVGKIS